jgi:N-acetylglucosaminyl-diphospho-decaprenol L-rhamnosyltransferase
VSSPVPVLPGPLSGVEIVLVSYHSRAALEGLLASWSATPAVAIVDNDGGAEKLSELTRTGVRVVPAGPGGFAGGANLGARTSSAEIVVFVNPDSRPSLEVLAALAEQLRSDPGLVAAAPFLQGPDGLGQIGTGGYEPTLLRTLVTAAGLASRFPGRGWHARPEPGVDMHFEWLSGACLAVRREVFLRLGGFDERYFVYCEDLALGRTVREAGLREKYRPDLVVPHEGAGSGGSSTYGAWLRGISLRDYLYDHHDVASGLLIRWVMALGILARIPLNLARSGDRDDSAEGWAYVRGILSPRRVRATRGRLTS